MSHTYDWPMAATTATVVIIARNPTDSMASTVIVGVRSKNVDTFPGMLCLPGGFQNVGKEMIENTAVRELEEETGFFVEEGWLNLFAVYSDPFLDPRGPTTNVCYWAEVPGGNVRGSDDLADAHWTTFNRLLSDDCEMAFNHKEIVQDAYDDWVKHGGVR